MPSSLIVDSNYKMFVCPFQITVLKTNFQSILHRDNRNWRIEEKTHTQIIQLTSNKYTSFSWLKCLNASKFWIEHCNYVRVGMFQIIQLALLCSNHFDFERIILRSQHTLADNNNDNWNIEALNTTPKMKTIQIQIRKKTTEIASSFCSAKLNLIVSCFGRVCVRVHACSYTRSGRLIWFFSAAVHVCRSIKSEK